MPGGGRVGHRGSQLESLSASSSLSTAALPQRCAISYAQHGEPSEEELRAAYVHGAEAISDLAHAGDELIPLPRRTGLWDQDADHSQCAESSKAAIWRTAGLSYPCSCNLPLWPHAYQPPLDPPTAAQLATLESSDEPHQLPLLGDDLLPWSTEEFGEQDLDSAMDYMLDFEHAWLEATPWPPPRPILNGKADRKGKARAIPPPDPSPLEAARTLHPISSGILPPSPLSASVDHATRKAWWRKQMKLEGGYGDFWAHVNRTTYPAPPRRRGRRPSPADNFRLPRNLHALAHPFHPDLAHFCATSGARVYWLIPIHGPVLIPGVEDPVVQERARPWASRAVFGDEAEVGEEKRPAVIRWTPASLAAFLACFEEIWTDQTHGPLHLAFSGAKPDPYLNIPPAAPLAAHSHLMPALTGATRIPPTRPEAGDHLRIYVDAARAMSLRTWLHWWETEKRRMFDKARFTLVGPRGEVLVVA